MTITIEQLLALPIDTPLSALEDIAATHGPSWWKALEGTVQNMECPHCRAEGLSLISAMHDLVNTKLGKPLYDEKNFQAVAATYAKVAEQLSKCSPSQATAVERCIQDIKASEDASVNPWAVCQASIGCALPHNLVDPWLPDDGNEDEDEDDKFMRKLMEALKRESKLEQSYRDYLGTLKLNLQEAVHHLERIMNNEKLVESLRHELSVHQVIDIESVVVRLNDKLKWAGRK